MGAGLGVVTGLPLTLKSDLSPVAFVELHVIVYCWPGATEEGVMETVQVGAGCCAESGVKGIPTMIATATKLLIISAA
jgi:hypothetical protein